MKDDLAMTCATEGITVRHMFQGWAKRILPIVQAAAEGEEIEIQIGGNWYPYAELHFGSSFEKYRINQNTRVINGFTVPEPINKEPKDGATLYVVSVDFLNLFFPITWDEESDGNANQWRFLERGLLFKYREDAIANAKAMLGIDPEKEDDHE